MKYLFLLFVSLTYIMAKPTVTVSILPQTYFIEKIAGDTLSVNVMVEPGNSPTAYKPNSKKLRALKKSDAYFAIGVPFENDLLKKFEKSFPNLRIIETHKGIKKASISKSSQQESHELHEVLAPDVWLNPLLIKKQAKNIAAALKVLYPKNEKLYAKNLEDFLVELDMLHKVIKTALFSKKKSSAS